MVSNPATRPADAQAAVQALRDAADTGGSAPSIHNTQPWRWRLHGDELDLFLDRSRTLEHTDPDDRLAIMSCGTALHHARVSLAADGRNTTVTRLPASSEPGHLATIRVEGRVPVDLAAVRDLRAISVRHTDRRRISDARIDADKLRCIVTAAERQDAALQVLRPGQVFALATAADNATRTETADAAWQAELQYWTGGTRPMNTGLPDAVIPSGMAPATVTSRDFGHHGGELIAEAQSRTAVFAILHAAADEPRDWLRAGEALSAAWLTATELQVSVLPLSATIEVPAVRRTMRHLLNDTGWPLLVLRFSVLDPAGGEVPHTPRRSSHRTIEMPAR